MLRNNGIINIIRILTSLVALSWNFMLLWRSFEKGNSFFTFEGGGGEEKELFLCWHSILARRNRAFIREADATCFSETSENV
jgi:hypothetical protein